MTDNTQIDQIRNQLKAEIDEVANQIKSLEARRYELENRLIGLADTFPEKFMIWLQSSEGDHDICVPDEDELPMLRNWLDENWGGFNRRQTVVLADVFYDQFYVMFASGKSEQEKDEWFESEDFSRSQIEAIAKEMFEANLKSFTFDW